MKALVIILLVIIAALVATVVYLYLNRPKVVEISDTLPEKANRRNCWLKLQNEGKQYLRIVDGKVYLSIVDTRKKK